MSTSVGDTVKSLVENAAGASVGGDIDFAVIGDDSDEIDIIWSYGD
jgi:hypothetical protein